LLAPLVVQRRPNGAGAGAGKKTQFAAVVRVSPDESRFAVGLQVFKEWFGFRTLQPIVPGYAPLLFSLAPQTQSTVPHQTE
jgi:hypothetical protein